MSAEIYNWQRQWHFRGERNIHVNQAYQALYGMYSDYGTKRYSFEQLLAKHHSLVLLGEPGIGKSTEMCRAYTALAEDECTEKQFLDLSSLQPKEIFEGSKFKTWQQSDKTLHMFLDSLDIASFVTLNYPDNLAYYINNLDNDVKKRLHLYIACRTASWPESLGNQLRKTWGNIATYELAPLQTSDITKAAIQCDLDADRFLEQIKIATAYPLAIKPVTLKLLLNIAISNEMLPNSQVEIYERGCELLCAENNLSRREKVGMKRFSPKERLNTAAQIAAIFILCGRSIIWRDTDKGNIPSNYIAEDELFALSEAPQMLPETLDTGLFSSAGEQRMKWAHQTYAEYLAARYISNNMQWSQISELIINPDNGTIYPQLYELASWMGSMDQDLFQNILSADPEALLRSGVITTNPSGREKLVDTYLQLINVQEILEDAVSRTAKYKRFDHPTLSRQLSGYIVDDNKFWHARYVAIDIAEKCELQNLEEDLIQVAFDDNSPITIRKQAAFAVSRIGSSSAKARLKPLIHGIPDDINDELKGAALFAVWPEHISVDELVTAITPRKQTYYLGLYSLFLTYERIEELEVSDLPTALRWTLNNIHDRHNLETDFEIDGLVAAIILRAWEHLDYPGVLEIFAKVAITQLGYFKPIVSKRDIFEDKLSKQFDCFIYELTTNHSKRRLLLKTIFPLMLDTPISGHQLMHEPSLLLQADFDWLIDIFCLETDPKMQNLLLESIRILFDQQNVKQADRLYCACQENELLAEQFATFFETDLQSETAKQTKLHYEQSKQIQKELQDSQKPIEPPPNERILTLLDQIEQGDSYQWWVLNHEMTLGPNDKNYSNLLEPDLNTLPGWINASKETQIRILHAGQKYLQEHDPHTETWFGQSGGQWPALAGYKAIMLLYAKGEDGESLLEPAIWKKWASIIAAYPSNYTESGNIEQHQRIVSLAYQFAGKELLGYLEDLLDRRTGDGKQVFRPEKLLARFYGCQDQKLHSTLLEKLAEPTLSIETTSAVLAFLLEQQGKEAISVSMTHVVPLSDSELQRNKAQIIVQQLIMYAQSSEWWPSVWTIFKDNPAFGRAVIENISDIHDYPFSLGTFLSEIELTHLYIWLSQQYPHSEDPELGSGFVAIPTRYEVAQWRDKLLELLAARETKEAILGFEQILDKYPDLYYARRLLHKIREQLRRQEWRSISPREVIALAKDNRLRLVQSEGHLLEVTIESLDRLQNQLQGVTPKTSYLWNVVKRKNICEPKTEEDLSDFVANHLKQDLEGRGIVANREVQIRRRLTSDGAPGERPDIQVDAFARTSNGDTIDTFTVVIEVKGSWHPELKLAMKEQLAGRYLKENNETQYGLYLVGWFNTQLWSDDDHRQRTAFRLNMDLDEARAFFEEQAVSLSRDGIHVRAYVIDARLREVE